MRGVVNTTLALFFLQASGKPAYTIQERDTSKMLLARSLLAGFNTSLVCIMILMIETHTATILGSLGPIASLVLEIILLGHPMTLIKAGIFGLSLVGTVLIIEPSMILPGMDDHLDRSANPPLGIFIGICGSVLTALNGIILKMGGMTSRQLR